MTGLGKGRSQKHLEPDEDPREALSDPIVVSEAHRETLIMSRMLEEIEVHAVVGSNQLVMARCEISVIGTVKDH